MLRWKLAGVVATLALLVGGGAAMRVASVASPAPPRGPAVLQLFYTAPVLVRAGERVRIPVDVICATADGEVCAATVSIRVTSAGKTVIRTVEATKGLQFDVTGPATRALGSAATGEVRFTLSARAGGRSVSLPERGGSLSFYVSRAMPTVQVPATPFGRVRQGRTVLFVPWGSGPARVGLSPGMESATLGPTSFGVDRSGRIDIVDGLQDRVAVFDHGTFSRQVRLTVASEGVLAVAPNGSSHLMDVDHGQVSVRSISGTGAVGGPTRIGEAIVSDLRAVSGEAYANLLPLDEWVSVRDGRSMLGMPMTGGRGLLRVAREGSIRLGIIDHGLVTHPVELRSTVKFGAVNLTEMLPNGSYLLVVRMWREAPTPADQYQVIVVRPDHSVRTFAVSSRDFTDTPPLARFRLGPDGALYQMTSSPRGLRIVRFDLEEEVR
jgi:hypothetical protein